VFVEFPWNPSDIDQSEGRLWRDGFSSERGISVHFLVGAGTIEEEIIEKLDAKKTVVEAVINGSDADHGTLLTHLRDKYMEEARQRRMNGTKV
jgi:SNF2 family DNA or RNA helicase